MNEYPSCPFCGGNGDIDTFNYANGTPRAFRVQCQECHAATGWKDTKEEAAEAWSLRTKTPSVMPQRNTFITKDLFLYKGEMYARNPYTEQCFKDMGGKMKRIKKPDYLLAYADCQKQLGVLK